MNQSLPDMTSLREEIVNTAQKAYREGMMAATSGNLSCYDAASGCIAITPSGMDYTIMKPEDIVIIDLDGNVLSGHKPSSEWKMHAEIYRHLPQYRAIVHTHSPNATAYAVLRREIPCVLVEMLLFLGGSIEVADYAAQGSAAVGTHCLPILSRQPAARQSRRCDGGGFAGAGVHERRLCRRFRENRPAGNEHRLSDSGCY